MTPIDKIAWIRLEGGKVLGTRSRGKDVYYLPGGKREPGETDIETLVREIHEELTVAITPATATHLGTFEAQAERPRVSRRPTDLRPPAPDRPARLRFKTVDQTHDVVRQRS